MGYKAPPKKERLHGYGAPQKIRPHIAVIDTDRLLISFPDKIDLVHAAQILIDHGINFYQEEGQQRG